MTESPENVAGLVGSSVTLRCAGNTLVWEEYFSKPIGSTISGPDRSYFPDKYDLITEPTGTYNLVIKSLELRDGGTYMCKAVTDTLSYTFVEVIVFNGKTCSCFSLIILLLFVKVFDYFKMYSKLHLEQLDL